MHSILAIGMPGGGEWLVIAILGVLLFGKRLPEVGRSLGKSFVEFKKGVQGIEDDINRSVEQPSQQPMLSSSEATTVPRPQGVPTPAEHPAD